MGYNFRIDQGCPQAALLKGPDGALYGTDNYGGQFNLPAGLTINPATGLVSGTPPDAGEYGVVVTATSASGSIPAGYTLTILRAVPVVNSATTASTQVNTFFSYQIAASHQPTSYNATGLPAGLTVGTAMGRSRAP